MINYGEQCVYQVKLKDGDDEAYSTHKTFLGAWQGMLDHVLFVLAVKMNSDAMTEDFRTIDSDLIQDKLDDLVIVRVPLR